MTTRCCSRKPSEYFLIQRLLYFYFRIKPVGFPGGMVKSLPAHAGGIRNANSIPGSGTYPGERHGSPLQYSCMENPMDGGAWWTTVHRITESDMTERLTLSLLERRFCFMSGA